MHVRAGTVEALSPAREILEPSAHGQRTVAAEGGWFKDVVALLRRELTL
ncbi:MAG: hypothetical protein IPG68_13370 [Micrococcales bacterium]|nr:hypothetical protein [Micrococcales bacterium]